MKTIYFLLSAILLIVAINGCSSDDNSVIPPAPSPYDLASFSKGGIMYDKFWSTEAGFNQNDTNIAKFNAKSDFFRCKQCHAWDYLGNAGSYINRAPNNNRPRVAGLNVYQYIQTKTPQEIFNGMKTAVNRRDINYDLTQYNPTTNFVEGDKMPNYSQILTDAQIWDIVKFLKSAMFDVSQLYDATFTGVYPTGTASYSNIGRDGNPVNGLSYYNSKCGSCHGSDGKQILLENMTLGKFTRSKPYEVQHKVKYGQLGSSMGGNFDITIQQMKDMYKAISDTLQFPNQ